jgi:hypothetical protein
MKTFFDAVAQWLAGGLTVFVDCTDVIGLNDFKSASATIYQEVKAMAAVAATYNFPKDKFAIGPINEWAGDDGHGGDPFVQQRKDLHDTLRAALPGYVLTVSSEYWDYYGRLVKLTPLSDQRAIYSFHAYENRSSSSWTSSAVGPLTTWSHQNGGLPILFGEAGPAFSPPTPMSAWPGWIGNVVPAMAVFRPTFWAITYGSGDRLNKSNSDPTLQDGTQGTLDLKTPLLNAIAAAQTALKGNDGSP